MARQFGIAFLTILSFSTQVLSLPSITQLNPFPINPHLIDNIIPLEDQFKITDPILTKGIPLTIRIPRELFTLTESFESRSRKVLEQSLPSALQQFGVPPDQIQGRVSEGIPLFINGIQELLSDDQSAKNGLQTRDILGSIFGWAKDAGCALVAAGGLPLFLLAAADFTVENTDASLTSPEQDFFLYPVWGNLAHDGPVKIYYQATRAPFFKGTSGTTFNRNVFTRLSPVQSFSESNYLDFEYLVQTLIHEFTHVDQYRRKGYDLTSFGYEYLFQWCSNGGYSKITLEVDAYATQNKVNQLLLFDYRNPHGNEFFQVWRTHNLGPALGNPIAQTFTTVSPTARELPFQLGMLQIQDGPCFRTFTNAEISFRAQSNCNPRAAQCHARREAMPPTNPKSDEPGPTGPRIPCDKEEKDAAVKECNAAKSAWASLDGRGWTCDLNLPIPPGPPPPPKAGCPPGCDIINLVPQTSHSCLFNEPPLGCDHAAAAAANAECKKKIQFCSSP